MLVKKLICLITKEENALTSASTQDNLSDNNPSSHEEGDTRMFLHLKHAVLSHIRIVDTDVVIISICLFSQLCALALSTLYIEFGTGKNYR